MRRKASSFSVSYFGFHTCESFSGKIQVWHIFKWFEKFRVDHSTSMLVKIIIKILLTALYTFSKNFTSNQASYFPHLGPSEQYITIYYYRDPRTKLINTRLVIFWCFLLFIWCRFLYQYDPLFAVQRQTHDDEGWGDTWRGALWYVCTTLDIISVFYLKSANLICS